MPRTDPTAPPPPPVRIRVVLPSDVTVRDIDDAALDLDWLLVRHWDASDDRPYEDQYVDRLERTTISFLDDTYLGLRYLVVRGRDVRAVADEARLALPVVTAREALDVLARATTPAERAAAVPAVALAADPGDRADAADALVRVARDGGPDERCAVIRVATYIGWPEICTVLVELRDKADDARVRRLAGAALDGLACEVTLGDG